MAKKKEDMNDDVTKAQEAVSKDARAVGRAARNQSFLQGRHDAIFGKGEDDWDATLNEIDEVDNEFEKESIMDKIRQQFGEGSVRVMEVRRDGTLTDVSDKVHQTDRIPGRNPQSREAALALLQQILPGLRVSNEPPRGSTANSIRKMEAALAEGDKILEHWKK